MIEAFSELFEQELLNRDLSEAERAAFAVAFRRYITQALAEENQRRQQRKRIVVFSAAGLTALFLCAALGYLLIARPLTPVTKVEAELQFYLGKVETGYGEYAKKYYGSLRRYDRKLGLEKTAEYRERMYAELDEQFLSLLEKIRAGEVVYYDDTRRWANLFPDAEERQARKAQASNAAAQAVGRAVGDSVRSVTDAAKGLLDKAVDLIKQGTDEAQP